MAELWTHVLQSTAFAGLAWLLALALRRNRASVRFSIYLAASMKFLVPFSALVSLGSFAPRPAHVAAAPAAWADAMGQFMEPLAFAPMESARASHPVERERSISWEPIAFAVWLCGLAVIGGCWLARWRRVRRLRRSATPVAPAAGCPISVECVYGLFEPGAFGVFRPVLLLPDGIAERLSAEELNAIVAHELCHVRRRDNLSSALHMGVQGIFWFHPLMWWLGARLVEERERACDEEVLALGNRPQDYASGILNVCKLYAESPLACIAGVTGSNLKRRIDTILENRRALALNRVRTAALTAAAFVAIALPIAVGMFHAPALHAATPHATTPPDQAQTPPQTTAQPPAAPPKPAPSQGGGGMILLPQTPQAEQSEPASPVASEDGKFEVASIHLCKPGDAVGRGGKGGDSGNSGLPESVGGYFKISPGRLDISCASIVTMIGVAYVAHGKALLNAHEGPGSEAESTVGLPKWAISPRYTIHAETSLAAANEPTDDGSGRGSQNSAAARLMYGPMLQALLEDRFQLKVHRETIEAPMYALTVAKGGLKVKPMKEGDCTPHQFGQPVRNPGPHGKPYCNWVGWDKDGPNRTLSGGGITLERFARELGSLILDRNVIDRTGIAGSYLIHLEYAPDENTRCFGPAQMCQVDANSEIPPGPTIFSALQQQLGLKLEPIKGPRERIVIDSVQPPSEN